MQKRFRILYVVESLGGGVLSYLEDLTNKLCEEFDIYIAYATRDVTPKDFKTHFKECINFIYVENFQRSISPVKDLKAFFEIKKIAKEVKPDIIHLHSSKAGAIGRFAFNGRKIPLFYTPHGYSFLMKDYSSMSLKIFRLIEKICGYRRCVTVSCSKGEHEESLKLTKNAEFINNGINLSKLSFDDLKEEPTVFTVGRICKQKNPELFNTIAMLLPDIHFLWIGDGEERNLLTSDNIEITGWLTREEANKKSLCGDIFLLTSLWEGLPISLLEAMYMKKLCIVSNVIGNKDVIASGENGYVCNTVEEFKDAILSYYDSAKTKALTEKAQKDVIENYNSDVMADKYKLLYMKYLKQ